MSTWANKLRDCRTAAAAVRDLRADRDYAVSLGAPPLTVEEQQATARRMLDLNRSVQK